MSLREAISKNIEKLSKQCCFFLYFDEKFDDNRNFFQRNTDNYKFFFKNCKIGGYLGKTGDREVEVGDSFGGLKKMEHICLLTNLIVNS